MQRRTKDFIVLGVKYKVSEDYAEDGTINTWVHVWNKRKSKWEWANCSNKPYEEVIESMTKVQD